MDLLDSKQKATKGPAPFPEQVKASIFVVLMAHKYRLFDKLLNLLILHQQNTVINQMHLFNACFYLKLVAKYIQKIYTILLRSENVYTFHDNLFVPVSY